MVPLRAISWLQLCKAHPCGTLLFQRVSQWGTPLLAPQTISKSWHSGRSTGPKPRCKKDETSRTPTQEQTLSILCFDKTYLNGFCLLVCMAKIMCCNLQTELFSNGLETASYFPNQQIFTEVTMCRLLLLVNSIGKPSPQNDHGAWRTCWSTPPSSRWEPAE